MKVISFSIVLTIILLLGSNLAKAQKFVEFETSSLSFETCQNRSLLVIANILVDDIERIEWSGNPSLKKYEGCNAFVNTSTVGEKEVVLKVFLTNGAQLDSKRCIGVSKPIEIIRNLK